MAITYSEIKNLSAFKIFKKFGLKLLVETIEGFFGCTVEIYESPKKIFLEKYEIGILANIKRGVYILPDNSTLILGRIFRGTELLTALGFLLKNFDAKKAEKLLNAFENVLTHNLTDEFENYFQNASLIFGDKTIKQTIVKYIGAGYYDARQIQHLIEYFYKLRTTSFEGKYFSTGAIFTKTHDLLSGTIDEKRFGTSKKLTNPFHISDTNKINKRIWYLVDGKTTFFLGNKNLRFNNIFTLNESYSNNEFLDTNLLALTLKGGDFLIRVENEKLMSIVAANGAEFSFFENRWRYRNYILLKEILSENITTDDNVINAIIFYIINCATSQVSTILWFPHDLDDINQYINTDTKNSFTIESVNITDKSSINHIIRCISSDGVSIIEKDGTLKYMGVIVDISKALARGITGTGESAASVLSANGLSIKISQDGVIKIFTNKSGTPYLF